MKLGRSSDEIAKLLTLTRCYFFSVDISFVGRNKYKRANKMKIGKIDNHDWL